MIDRRSTPRSIPYFGKRHRLSTLVLTGALVFGAWFALATPSMAANDARAVAVAEKLLETMGGADALAATRFVRFNFFGFRTHHWDRHTGDHRLEGQTREGQSYVVLHNINSREGHAWLDGDKLAGDAAAEWLERAYGAWINDVYWLFMPYKLLDPGVNLADAGEETIDGTTYDKVKLTFGEVGLTPGDTYWAYVNRETGLMDRWAYHLQDWEADREPTVWTWEGWQRFGGIMLAPKRYNAADDRTAELKDIAVFDTLPETVFTAPGPVAP